MRNLKFINLVILLGILVYLFSSVYMIREGQRGLLLRLGAIVNDNKSNPIVLMPGLGFKTPFINQVRLFDIRLQTLAVQSSRIMTQEKKDVLVDYYIKWRVENLPLYYQRTGGDELRAQTLLQQQVNDALRAAFGQRTITDMVSGERENVMELLTKSTNETAKNLGMEVIDVRIKSIDLPAEVSGSVFARMRTRREQVATQHRADGKAKAEGIRASADAKASVATAEAKTKAANIRAQGSAEAAKIYSQAYDKSPDFFLFYRSLKAYEISFKNKNDFLVLTPDNEFFKYFNNITDVRTAAVSKN